MLDPAGQRQIIQNNLSFLYDYLRKYSQKCLIILLNEIIFNNHQIIQIILKIDY